MPQRSRKATPIVGADVIAGTAISRLSPHGEARALICGLPSSLTYFAADLCRDLLARAHGACEVIGLNDLSPESIDKLSAVGGGMLIVADVPDAAVAEWASDGEFPIIVVEQGFANACRDFMAARNAALLDTARTMARCQIGANGLAAIPRAILVGADEDGPAALLAKDISAALSIGEHVCLAVVDERELGRQLCEVLDAHFAYRELRSSNEADVIIEKLDRFYGVRTGENIAKLEVPMEMLLEAVAPYLPATESIDLLGPARCLTFGPYLYLPKGRWRANFTFLSSDNRSSNTIGIDIAADHEIKIDRSFDLDASGKFGFQGEFEIDDPFSPLEFRVFLRRGSIEGRFQPLSLTLEPHDDEPD